MVDKHSWVDVDNSYLPSELQAAYLWGQLERADDINQARLSAWQYYWQQLTPLAASGCITLATTPEDCQHNAHMFYLKTANLAERSSLLEHLKSWGIMAVFHYVPLHTAKAGEAFGRFHGKDLFTTGESERLVRLPMWFEIEQVFQQQIIDAITDFYQ